MKKLYFSMGLLLAGTAVMAQGVKTTPLTKELSDFERSQKVSKEFVNQAKAVTIWTNDCSNAADFVFSNQSIPALDWAIETDPAAIPVPVLSPMGSATASNGYLFINSDAAPNVNGGFPNADGDGSPIVATARIATPIDLTGYPDVVLTFASNFRWWQDTRTVRVSGDNGATWTDFEISNGNASPPSQNTLNPTIERIDISAVAGGQSQVLIEFYYNDNDIWAWYWAVDDIAIVTKEPNDLAVTKHFRADLTSDVEYSMVPMGQISPMNFGLEIKNVGANDQYNVGFSYDIINGGASVASGTAVNTLDTLLAGAMDSVFETTSYTPTAIGQYMYTLTAVSDSTDDDATNNVAMDSLEVTNYIWAVDDGSFGARYGQLFDADSTEPFKVGNLFFIKQTDTIWSLDIGIHSSNMGQNSAVYGEIWMFDNGSGTWTQMATSLDLTLTPGDNGNWVNVDFDGGYVVNQGDAILAFAGHYGGAPSDRVWFAAGGKEGVVRLGLVDGTVARFSGDNPPPQVRLNFNRMSNTVNVEENLSVVSLEQNMPNPAKDNTVITYSLLNNTDVTLVITDANGRVVKTMTQNNQSQGTHVFNVDVSDLANGVYQYTLSGAGSSVTKSMVVSK